MAVCEADDCAIASLCRSLCYVLDAIVMYVISLIWTNPT